jgi:hypothetical protein
MSKRRSRRPVVVTTIGVAVAAAVVVLLAARQLRFARHDAAPEDFSDPGPGRRETADLPGVDEPVGETTR